MTTVFKSSGIWSVTSAHLKISFATSLISAALTMKSMDVYAMCFQHRTLYFPEEQLITSDVTGRFFCKMK